ncbi:hypothetical protein U1Q18_041928, partial [Sarracenia purpurea var. burkii]
GLGGAVGWVFNGIGVWRVGGCTTEERREARAEEGREEAQPLVGTGWVGAGHRRRGAEATRVFREERRKATELQRIQRQWRCLRYQIEDSGPTSDDQDLCARVEQRAMGSAQWLRVGEVEEYED